MALVLGTNCGFVTVAPTSNPSASIVGIQNQAHAFKVTAPSDASKITEIGWWIDASNSGGNYEVGLYSHDSGSDAPLTLLGSNKTNSLAGSNRWTSASVDIAITGDTIYWLVVQVDSTTSSFTDRGTIASERRGALGGITTLPDPTWSGGSFSDDSAVAIYALFEVAEGVNHQIISGDGLSWFTTEYFGAWLMASWFIMLSIINTLKQFSGIG